MNSSRGLDGNLFTCLRGVQRQQRHEGVEVHSVDALELEAWTCLLRNLGDTAW